MDSEATDIDVEIAEFHRAARRRKTVIFAIAALVLVGFGIAALVIAFVAEAPAGGSGVR